jgi:hypothetical protein
MTWFNPDAYAETFRCDYCDCDFAEDDLTEYERDKWACDDCARANDEEAAAMHETAEDDRAHAMRDRALGL